MSATWFGHPRGLATLFFTEMWERFSYYGMRAILVLALVANVKQNGLGLSDETATAIYGLYTAGVYMLALAGGWIADRLIGQQRALWYGGILIACGHFTMALPFLPTFYIGMVLIVLGTGLLKPSISSVVGQLYANDSGARRDAAFSIFYMGINVGGFIGPLICGYLGERVGWHYGFGAAGVFMTLGLVQFRLTRHYLGDAGKYPADSGDVARDALLRQRATRVIAISVLVIMVLIGTIVSGWLPVDPRQLGKGTGIAMLTIAVLYFAYVLLFGKLSPIERKRVAIIVVLFCASVFFWSGFEQAGSSFNLFADRYTDRMMFGWEVPASWLQSINSLFIIACAPIFAALWVQLAARHLSPSTPGKMGLGLIQLGLGFLVLYFAAQFVVRGEKVAPTWLIVTYLFHTTGELCLSPVGLSAVTKLSPTRYVGQMMGTWFMSMALGNLIAGLTAGLFGNDSVPEMPHRFLMVFMVTAGAGVVMLLIAPAVRKAIGGAEQ
jgi:POT family proton-dependent oligopeptide transporter